MLIINSNISIYLEINLCKKKLEKKDLEVIDLIIRICVG